MQCFIPQDLYGVIGWPLAQTLSPLLHNTGFQVLGIPGTYMGWPIEPEQLKSFVESLRMLKVMGVSVTIPHKISIMKYLDSVSESAALAGAVNTLYWREGTLCGDNTDVPGFLSPLRDFHLDKMEALLLGAGGAAHAVASALKLSDCRHVRVTSASDKRQFELAERFGFSPILWKDRYSQAASIVINATPLGMTGKFAAETPYDFALAPEVEDGWAYDLVYNPRNTIFLQNAALHGRNCISGFEMFFGQGNAQFKLWTGQDLPRQSRIALEYALKAQTGRQFSNYG